MLNLLKRERQHTNWSPEEINLQGLPETTWKYFSSHWSLTTFSPRSNWSQEWHLKVSVSFGLNCIHLCALSFLWFLCFPNKTHLLSNLDGHLQNDWQVQELCSFQLSILEHLSSMATPHVLRCFPLSRAFLFCWERIWMGLHFIT